MAQAAASSVATIATGVWNGITTVATGLQWLFNAALLANPIALVILAIVAIIAIGVLLITHWQAVVDMAKTVWTAVVGFFTSLWSDITRIVGDIIGWVTANWPLLLGILTGPIGLAIAWVATHFTQVEDTVKTVMGDIKSFFADAGTWLLAAGKAIIQGLINGVTSMIGGITSAIGNVVSIVKKIPVVGGLFGSPSPYYTTIGQAIGQGLANGITGSQGLVASAATGLAKSAIAPMSLGAGNLAVAGSLGSGGGGSAGGKAGGVVYSPTYNIPVTGDMSPQTALYVKQQLLQHDQQLITTLNAL
jgi:phage-related protein